MLAFRVMGVFFWFAATAALYAAVTLAWPGTPLDRLWAVNPAGHAGLAPLGRVMGLPFLALAIVAAIVGWGWLRRRRYAWYGLVGVIAAGLLLVYLARPSTRRHFRSRP